MSPNIPSTPESSELKFDLNGIATTPYSLSRHPTWGFIGYYCGDALLVGGHAFIHTHLTVPSAMAAVVLMANGESHPLKAGKHPLNKLPSSPVSVQFVNMQMVSHDFSDLSAHSMDRLDLTMTLRLTLQVANPKLIIEWATPFADIHSTLAHELKRLVSTRYHDDCLQQLPDLVKNELLPSVARLCQSHGLNVQVMLLTALKPDERQDEIERKSALFIKQYQMEENEHQKGHEASILKTHRDEELANLEHERVEANLKRRKELAEQMRLVELLEAQVAEDIAAMQQLSNKRKGISSINIQQREKTYEIRLKAIDTLSAIVRAVLEERNRYPGQFTNPDDNPLLTDAIAMIKEWTAAPKAIESPPIRSFLSVAEHPEAPPVAQPIRPDGTIATSTSAPQPNQFNAQTTSTAINPNIHSQP